MAIQSFTDFCPQFDQLQEAKKFDATQWEQLIVIAFNGGWRRDRETFDIAEADYRAVEPIAKKIAQDIKQATQSQRTEMLHFGTGAGETVRMVDWWKGKNTPKTDCYTSSGIRISLKKKGGSQLISGLKNETLSTFTAATKYMNAAPDAYASLLSQIETALTRRINASVFNINTIAQSADDIEKYRAVSTDQKAQLAAIGIDSETDLKNWIDDVITFKKGETRKVSSVDREEIFTLAKKMVGIRKEFQKLTPIIQEWFENNPDFKLWFTYEAASGHLKFAPTPKASANWIVEFDTDGERNAVNRLELAGSTAAHVRPSSYLRALSQKTTFRLGFKTSSGSGKGGVTAASLRSGEKSKAQVATERTAQDESRTLTDLDYFAESTWRDLMESTLLTEGIWDSVKSAFASVAQMLTAWLSRIIAKLRELLSKGIEAFLSFIGVSVESVDVDGINMLFSE